MNNNRLYVDFHVLQTVPPSCVNRDDMGAPKTAEYGGKKRARVSSQSWKRAVREEFKSLFASNQLGYRTKKMAELVAAKLQVLDPALSPDDAMELATSELKAAKLIAGSDKKEVLFFISSGQVDALAQVIHDAHALGTVADVQAMKAAIMDNPSIDLCLFGRMSASDPALNFDAAAQVAHSISTHPVSSEYDYFTAVDDCSTDGGSGHLGTAEFNSSTLYRYANVNISELMEHMSAEEAVVAVRGFAEAFVKSMPTGKMNSFANRTLPDMVYVTLRTDQPINLVGAFEKPIYAGNSGYMAHSKIAFEQYAAGMYKDWVSAPPAAWHVGDFGEEKDGFALGTKCSLNELFDALHAEMKKRLM